MASSTRKSLASAKAALQPLLAEANLALATDLFAVSSAVADSAQLRNLLSDPSAEAKAKSGAVSAVFAKSVSAKTVSFLTDLVALRWSKGSDLVAAIEQLGVYVVASLAAKSGSLKDVENELFAFQQVVESNQELQFALASKQADSAARSALVAKLLGSKASAEGAELVRNAVVASRKRRVSLVLEQYGKWVSEVAQRHTAKVTVARPLAADQLQRLEAALTKSYGGSVKVNVEIDPALLGGLRVQIGDEIIDGSLVSRLNQARLQLA